MHRPAVPVRGDQAIGAYGLHRTAVLMFVLSSAACAFAGGFAYQKYNTLNAAVLAAQRQGPHEGGGPRWSRVASPEKKELLSQAVAKRTFAEYGTLGLLRRPPTARPGRSHPRPTISRLASAWSRTTRAPSFAARGSLAERCCGDRRRDRGDPRLAMSLAKPPAPKAAEEEALSAEPPLHASGPCDPLENGPVRARYWLDAIETSPGHCQT